MSPFELSVHFFLQLACILCFCRLVSWITSRFDQPPVGGEMIAGVLLGPSLFGLIAPHTQAWLMELIILNIGLERGLITPVLFSIMVLMAVLTTLMSTPLFNLTYARPEKAVFPDAGKISPACSPS